MYSTVGLHSAMGRMYFREFVKINVGFEKYIKEKKCAELRV